MEDKISELKRKYETLKHTLDSKRKQDGKILLKKQFIGTIGDFNIITDLETSSWQEIAQHYSLEEIEHLIQTIDEYNNPVVKSSKLDFSMHTIIAINDLLKGNEMNYKELLEVLYMTIFQRYNDDINKSKNYKVTLEFLDKVYRKRNSQSKEKSEKDVGDIFMTHNEYKILASLWSKEYSTEKEREIVFKKEIVNYILNNIRNRMMHGDFENRTDKQGNKIVQISPYGFKAKFSFDCIIEFYEAVSNAIKTGEQVQDNDVLFDFEQVFLKKEGADTSILDDKDKIMALALPLYINGFITYNFRNKNEFEKLQKEFAKQEQKTTSEQDFLNQYYKKKDENSFIYQVADYYQKHKEEYYSRHQDVRPVQDEYTAHDIFEHLRNSIVHNNFKCENGMVHIRDFDENNVETANFFFPYEMFENFIEEQTRHAKQHLGLVCPEETDLKSGTSINVDKEKTTIELNQENSQNMMISRRGPISSFLEEMRNFISRIKNKIFKKPEKRLQEQISYKKDDDSVVVEDTEQESNTPKGHAAVQKILQQPNLFPTAKVNEARAIRKTEENKTRAGKSLEQKGNGEEPTQ